MPTYDYKCENCGHKMEAFQSMKDERLKTCPVCNTDSLKRMIGAGAGLIFKGSGFYLTDYKNNKPAKSNSSDSASTSDSKTETKTDSKTETKAEVKSSSKSSDDSSKSEK